MPPQMCHPNVRQVHAQMKNNLPNLRLDVNTGRKAKEFGNQQGTMSLSFNKRVENPASHN